MKMNTKKLTGIAMLSAISICSLYLIRFSIFPAIAFMEYDVADVFIFLGTFMYGPISGLIMTLVVSLYQAFLMGGNGLTGALMHFLATGTFCLVSGFLYKKNRCLKGAIISLVIGFFVWIVVMIGADFVIIPLFLFGPTPEAFNMGVEMVASLIWYIVAFNAIKAGANSLLTFLLYKRIRKLFAYIGISEKVVKKIVEIVSPGVYYSSSPKETEDIAKRFCKNLLPGDTVLLNGDLGAGKTVFARGIARGLGIVDDVVSPTFNILKEYGDGKLYHFDMYRIEDKDELENLGFEEYFGSSGICVVEWNRMEKLTGRVFTVNITNINGKKSRKIEISQDIK